MTQASGTFRALPRMMAALLLVTPLALASDSQKGKGFEHLYNLEYDRAIAEFRREIALRPEEPAGYNHLAQAILYRAMYQQGILENAVVSGQEPILSLIRQPKLRLAAADRQDFLSAMDTADALAHSRLRANSGDAGAIYALGVAHGIRANYDFLARKAWLSAIRHGGKARKLHNFLARKAWLSAIRHGGKARKLHSKAYALDPSHADALFIQGIHNYVVASLPAGLRVLAAAAGVRGDKEAALRTLETVAKRGNCNRVDARILLTVLYRREEKSAMAVPLLDELLSDFPRNYLLHFAQIHAYIESGNNLEASDSLRSLENRIASGAPGYGGVRMDHIEAARKLIHARFGCLDCTLVGAAQAAAKKPAYPVP